MEMLLLISAVIILACVAANRISNRIGIPALLLFLLLGMAFGSDGIFKISYSDYDLTEKICSTALIFILFYGGFNTKWEAAAPTALKAGLLSTAGVLVTALLTGWFCHFALGFSMAEGFLTGAVISSTDAASVFSILRSRKLSLREGTDSMLELESGSNDPMSYMLTMIGLALLENGKASGIGALLFSQVVYGVLAGALAALAGVLVLRRTKLAKEGLGTIFLIALCMLAYAVPAAAGGNGYLSVYLAGILTGNSRIKNKVEIGHFFDGVTGLSQMLIFFLLGLLAFPHRMPMVLGSALAIVLFLTFAARPAAVFAVLKPFGSSMKQCLVVSFAGLRGAASVVFAIMVISSGAVIENDLFHIVFFVALLSVAVQGSLLPAVAGRLGMVDENADVRKTFNDYQEESAITLMRFYIPPGHNWENKRLKEVHMPTGSLALMIRRGKETLIPRGDTVILAKDSLILSVPSYDIPSNIKLREKEIGEGHPYGGKIVKELKLPRDNLVIMIKRNGKTIIPQGETRIETGDVLVLYDQGEEYQSAPF